MRTHLSRLRASEGKAGAEENVIQASFQNLEHQRPRCGLTPLRFLKIAAELTFPDAERESQLLLFEQLTGILGAPTTPRSRPLAGTVRFAFENTVVLIRKENVRSVPAAELCFWSCVSHEDKGVKSEKKLNAAAALGTAAAMSDRSRIDDAIEIYASTLESPQRLFPAWSDTPDRNREGFHAVRQSFL